MCKAFSRNCSKNSAKSWSGCNKSTFSFTCGWPSSLLQAPADDCFISSCPAIQSHQKHSFSYAALRLISDRNIIMYTVNNNNNNYCKYPATQTTFISILVSFHQILVAKHYTVWDNYRTLAPNGPNGKSSANALTWIITGPTRLLAAASSPEARGLGWSAI